MIILGLRDRVDRELPLILHHLGALRDDHVPEGVEILVAVRGVPHEVLLEVPREDVQEVRLELLILKRGASCLSVVLDEVLELGHSLLDVLQVFNRA